MILDQVEAQNVAVLKIWVDDALQQNLEDDQDQLDEVVLVDDVDHNVEPVNGLVIKAPRLVDPKKKKFGVNQHDHDAEGVNLPDGHLLDVGADEAVVVVQQLQLDQEFKHESQRESEGDRAY